MVLMQASPFFPGHWDGGVARACREAARCSGGARFAAVLGAGIVLAMTPATFGADSALRKLHTRLDRILTQHKQPHARFGAQVVELPGGRVLYERDARTPLIPASNMKLVVIASAIEQLGIDYRYETVLAIRDRDLVVIGSGDPTFGDERIAKGRGESITAVFHRWAARLHDAGVRQIPGDLVIDDSIFDRQFTHPNWPPNQHQAWYEAPIGGLNFNANCVSVRVTPSAKGRAKVAMIPGNRLLRIENKTVANGKKKAVVNRRRGSDVLVVAGTVKKAGVLGPITVSDPGLYFGSVLKTVLAAKGIRVYGRVVRKPVRLADGRLPSECHVVSVHRAGLAGALGRAGKNSLGMAAEGLLKTLGAERSGRGTWRTGIAAVEAFMRTAGVPADQATIDDGSGLSRENRVSPAAAVQVLGYMFRRGGKAFDLFRNSLAQSGIDGSLENRMKSRDTRGRIFAKTGYIRGVRTLAGYIHTHTDQWLGFAFYYNRASATRPMTQAQDRACRLLVHWPDLPPGK